MTPGEEHKLGARLLDAQLVDRGGFRCGRVDDIELDGGPGRETSVAALLTGPGVWPDRIHANVRRVAAAVLSPLARRIAWDEVEEIRAAVQLRQTIRQLGLDPVDPAILVSRPRMEPLEPLRLSALMAARILTDTEEQLGRVYDVLVEQQGRSQEPGRQVWRLSGLLVGRGGLLQEFGLRHPQEPPVVHWDAVRRIEGRTVVVAEEGAAEQMVEEARRRANPPTGE